VVTLRNARRELSMLSSSRHRVDTISSSSAPKVSTGGGVTAGGAAVSHHPKTVAHSRGCTTLQMPYCVRGPATKTIVPGSAGSGSYRARRKAVGRVWWSAPASTFLQQPRITAAVSASRYPIGTGRVWCPDAPSWVFTHASNMSLIIRYIHCLLHSPYKAFVNVCI
jgi:hypothetical protein